MARAENLDVNFATQTTMTKEPLLKAALTNAIAGCYEQINPEVFTDRRERILVEVIKHLSISGRGKFEEHRNEVAKLQNRINELTKNQKFHLTN